MQDTFKMEMGKLLGHLAPKGEAFDEKHMRNLFFGDFMDPQSDSKIYDEVSIHMRWGYSGPT